MATETRAIGIPADVLADAQTVAEHAATGQPLTAEVLCRVSERTDKARQRILAAHGVQNIGVQLIREIRGELPKP